MSSPPSRRTVIGLGGAAEEGGDRGAAGAGARGERLPHPALEDPRPHRRAVDADERDVGAVRETAPCSTRSPARSRARSSSSTSSPTSITHCGLPTLTCWKPHSRPSDSSVPRAVGGPGREVGRADRGAAERHRDLVRARDRRRHLPRLGEDRERVGVGPAGGAQVEHRLAGAVARELGLRAVGVEDPQLGHVALVGGLAEQQDAVGADPEVGLADAPDPLLGELPGQRRRLDDDVVVAERLPLLELHLGANPSRATRRSRPRPRRRLGPCGRSARRPPSAASR